MNESVILSLIVKEMDGSHLLPLMRECSDYAIRRKNSMEDRIFSYDKPNKYRTDIDNVVELALNLKPTDIKSEVDDVSVIESYKMNILERNEYQFETIIRMLLKDLPHKS